MRLMSIWYGPEHDPPLPRLPCSLKLRRKPLLVFFFISIVLPVLKTAKKGSLDFLGSPSRPCHPKRKNRGRSACLCPFSSLPSSYINLKPKYKRGASTRLAIPPALSPTHNPISRSQTAGGTGTKARLSSSPFLQIFHPFSALRTDEIAQ